MILICCNDYSKEAAVQLFYRIVVQIKFEKFTKREPAMESFFIAVPGLRLQLCYKRISLQCFPGKLP